MQRFNRLMAALLLLFLLLGPVVLRSLSPAGLPATIERIQIFVTIFLGIFIEAAPFLLAGSLVSGLIEVFVDPGLLGRLTPRRPVLAALAGAGLGLAFPVCECGVVPVTRRLYQKGLPPSVGIAFLLAAPVVNPVVIASTYTAFGWGWMLLGRLGLSFLIAAGIGFLFHLARPDELLLSPAPAAIPVAHAAHEHAPAGHSGPPSSHSGPPSSHSGRIWEALTTAGDDFLDMARYLILGSMLAAGMQTLVPQAALLAVGGGPFTSVVTMLALAFVLSICSTVDAFLALAFVNTFTPASILGFLVFGPMVDVKSSLMFLGVFRRRAVAYLILLPLMMVMAATTYLNLNLGG
jgi:uncharacterized membrane protein YraQ (UPF0718 family)